MSNQLIRFVIFASYGNDSVALIQWAHEWALEGVTVVYSDTGWAAADWQARVAQMEAWVETLGFQHSRTTSIGFRDLARQKKGFPTQRYQWCSHRLKIEPAERWLRDHDPDARAICVVGVRHEEAANATDDRAKFPEYLPKSANHGDRFLLAPFVKLTAADRDGFLTRAGVEPLPHRSRECRCINSNRTDFRGYTEADIEDIEQIEREVGKTMFRPHRHMGAKGIREVIRWANSERGKYESESDDRDTCESMHCDN